MNRTLRFPRQRNTVSAHARVPGWCGPCHRRPQLVDTTAAYRLWRCPGCSTKWPERIAQPRPPDPTLNLGRDEAIAACRQAIADARARAVSAA
jgi:hypothetical protein